VERFSYAKHIGFGDRTRRLGFCLLILLAVLTVRLIHLQIIFGEAYRRLSDSNRYRLQRLDAPRGRILDRNGEVLVDNRPVFVLSAVPREVDDPEATAARLAELVAIDSEKIVNRINRLRRDFASVALHVRIKEDLPFREVVRVEEAMTDLPGIMIASRPVRRYVLGDLAAPVLGYIGEIDERQLERLRDSGYYPGSLIGKTGVERVCEEHLRGVDGGVLVEVHSLGKPQVETDLRGRQEFPVDSLGRSLHTERRREPEPGHKVYLTIDRRIQQLAEKALGAATGAVVVMDVDTGDILALASKPAYDPNVFVGTGKDEQRSALLNDPQHPLLNRAFQANYAPGSTVKPMVAIAALETGAITRDTRLECYGSYDIGRRFRCWNRQGHGTISVVDAIAHSCDVFLYQLGERLGAGQIAEYLSMFGLGQPTRIGLRGENRGLLPTAEWKEGRFGEAWYRGDTANFSIGQGFMLATPLQLARAYAALVNGGRVLQPRLVHRIEPETGDNVIVPEMVAPRVLNVQRKSLETVVEGLRKAVEKQTYPHGTGYLAKVEGIDIIGKTGTAQVVASERTENAGDDPEAVPYQFRDHAWFVAVVTDQQPRIVVCVMMEHVGHGGETAAPAAGDLIRKIYAGEEVLEPPVVAESTELVRADG